MTKHGLDENLFSGQILDNGLCICAICGKKTKMAGIIKPKEPGNKPQVACYDCMAEDMAKTQNKTKEQVIKEQERIIMSSRLYQQTMAERYLKETGKKRFADEKEITLFLELIRNAWNNLGMEFHKKSDELSLEGLKEVYRTVKVDFKLIETGINIHTNGKPGRNDICPCGSGKKYKKCCGGVPNSAGKKILVFKVSLLNDPEVYRELALIETDTLYKFAKTIIKSFDFDFDHAFGFFSDVANWSRSERQYELFKDVGEKCKPGTKGVKKVSIKEAFEKDNKMLFLFDYGDEWKFIVELARKEEIVAGSRKKHPLLLQKIGESPEQYPAIEEEEEKSGVN